MSLPRQQARNASIVTLLAERLKQAGHLVRALPPDWRDGELPMSAIEDIARELRGWCKSWLAVGHRKPGAGPGLT